jgi:peptidyl-prolyl cis-trans isomerase SurA
MKNLIKVTAISLVLLLTFANAISQTSIDKKTLVTIGDEDVTAGEFIRVYEKNNTQADLYEADAVEDYLKLYTNFKLKVLEAEALMMDTSSTFIKELEGYRTQLAKPYFVDETVNESLLKEAYERSKIDIRASHILIMVDENATPEDTLRAYNKISNILEEIKAGKNFDEAAIEHSDDPSARDREAIPNKQRFKKGNKGDLGYFTVFNMVYPFENAAYTTGLNDISPIIRTKYGYHILQINDNKDAMGIAEVAHIFVALRPEASEEDSLRKAEKINNIYSKIQKGLSFEEAVTEYSEDKGSIKQNGKLSAFSCNRVVPEFVSVVDKLEVDDISEPVQTAYGFHIIKLISIKKPGTLEEESSKLEERLTKDKRSRKSEDAVITSIKKENKFKEFPKAKTEIFAAIDTSVLSKRFVAEGLVNMTDAVMRLKKDKYSQYDFAKFVEIKQRIQDNIDKDVYLNQLYNEFVKENCIDFMDQNLENQYPDFKDLVQEYHDGILLFNLTDEMVWTKAVKDTIGLQKFFDENRSKYSWGERVEATIYQVRDNSVIDQVKEIIISNDNDGDIAKAFDNDSIKSIRILPGFYETGDDKFIDMVEWKPGLSDPIKSDVENLTVFVKITNVIPPQPKELADARGLITADYQSYLEKEWIEELKTKYPVSLNTDVLQLIIEEKNK